MSIGTEIKEMIMVRVADPDVEPVHDWCNRNFERNHFDKDVLTYPATKVLAAHSDGKVFAYMPVQGTAMLESIGPNPDATAVEVAHGIMELVRGAALLAYSGGYRELYFLASDETTAKGAEMLGFEEVKMKCYRRRLE